MPLQNEVSAPLATAAAAAELLNAIDAHLPLRDLIEGCTKK